MDEQLPPSTFTPVELPEPIEWREAMAWLDSISGRLEDVKRDFVILYPAFIGPQIYTD